MSGTSSLNIFESVFDSKAELIYDKSLSGQQLVDEPEALRKFDTKSSLNEVVEAFWLFGAFLICDSFRTWICCCI